MLGTSALKGRQKSNVYFGNYKQSSDGQGGYNNDPIKWRVLDADNDYNRDAVEGETDTTRSLFLLSDQNIDALQYHAAYESITWAESTIRSWLNGYDRAKNKQLIDYSDNNFIDTAFSEDEQKAIVQTSVRNDENVTSGVEGGSDTEDPIFLLSLSEVMNAGYGFTDDASNTDTRVSKNTAYIANDKNPGGNMSGSGSAWNPVLHMSRLVRFC